MRAPLLSFVLILAVVATVHLVPAVCISRYEKLESKGEEAGTIDGYGPLEKKATGKTKDHILNPQATPAMTANTYDQKPSTEQAEMASTSTLDEKEAPTEVKKEKSEKSDESAVPKKKVKKEKKKKSDDSDKNSEPSYGSSSVENFEPSYGSTSPKKQKEETSDYLDESTSPKKEKKKKKAKSDALDQDVSLSMKEKKKEKKSGDSVDKVTSHKKQKKEKKGKKSDKENPEEDAAPVDVSTDGAYVPSSPFAKEEKSDEEASTPVDVSTTTAAQYLNALAHDGKPKANPAAADAYASPDQLPPGAKSASSSAQPMAAGSPDELPPSATSPDAYASPDELPPGAKNASSSAQPMAAGSPDELPPSATSPDAYASPDELPPGAKSASSTAQPMAAGSPDELPPSVKSASATPDPYAAMKFAAGADGQPLQPAPGMPKLSMDMIKKPIVKILSPVIKGVCAQTQYPTDCEASIGGLPGAASAAATDSAAVLKLAMQAVRERVIKAANTATARMNAPGTDKQMKEAFSSCASSYNNVKASLDTVDDALKNDDIDTANTNLNSVETDVTDCDQYFVDFGDPSLMRDHDKELSKLTNNLVAIGAALRPHH